MGTVFGPLITACCGAITTLVVFTLTAIIQNLPEIMELLGRGWDAIFQLTYHLYRGIIEVLPAFLGFKKPVEHHSQQKYLLFGVFYCFCMGSDQSMKFLVLLSHISQIIVDKFNRSKPVGL